MIRPLPLPLPPTARLHGVSGIVHLHRAREDGSDALLARSLLNRLHNDAGIRESPRDILFGTCCDLVSRPRGMALNS